MMQLTDKAIIKAWIEDGQGHSCAVSRGNSCFIIKCNKNDAINITRWFIEKAFSMPSCTHYDGQTLSIYCGEAGSGFKNLYDRVKAFSDKLICEQDVTRVASQSRKRGNYENDSNMEDKENE